MILLIFSCFFYITLFKENSFVMFQLANFWMIFVKIEVMLQIHKKVPDPQHCQNRSQNIFQSALDFQRRI
jgi:hypothetical protein